jgi:hypothetical protein
LGAALGKPETIRLGFDAKQIHSTIARWIVTVTAATRSNFIRLGTNC